MSRLMSRFMSRWGAGALSVDFRERLLLLRWLVLALHRLFPALLLTPGSHIICGVLLPDTDLVCRRLTKGVRLSREVVGHMRAHQERVCVRLDLVVKLTLQSDGLRCDSDDSRLVCLAAVKQWNADPLWLEVSVVKVCCPPRRQWSACWLLALLSLLISSVTSSDGWSEMMSQPEAVPFIPSLTRIMECSLWSLKVPSGRKCFRSESHCVIHMKITWLPSD